MAKVLCPECRTVNDSGDISCSQCMSDLNLNNKYLLLKIIDEHSVTTYLAYDRRAKQKIIIKEFSLINAQNWDSHDLFKKEGDILAQLDHPSIPQFIEDFEIGIGDSSKSYIVMEYIDGMSLKEEQRKNRYTEEEVIEDILEVARILDYLHNLLPPIVHQDLNLSNIMRRKNGSLALIDFNAVKDVVIKDRSNDITGTFGFIAPEQLMGKAVVASDYYSLGVVILVLLTRKEPDQMLDDDGNLNWKSSIRASKKIISLLDKLLIKSPRRRLQSLKDIESILAESHKSSNNKKQELFFESFETLDGLNEIKDEIEDEFEEFFVQIDECIGCSSCVNTAGANFFESDAGYAYVRKQPKNKKEFSRCQKAMDNCPVSAIREGKSNGGTRGVYKNQISKRKNDLAIEKNQNNSIVKEKSNNTLIAYTTIIAVFGVAYFLIMGGRKAPMIKSVPEKIIKQKPINTPIKKVKKNISPDEQHLVAKKYQDLKDYKNANIQFLEACNKGNIKSCEFLGWNYEKGFGFEKNMSMAKKYYLQACNANSGYSCNKMAYYLESESKSRKNLIAARILYKKSCDLNYALGCNNLADFKLKGKGGKKSRRGAKVLYKKACKLGYKKACGK